MYERGAGSIGSMKTSICPPQISPVSSAKSSVSSYCTSCGVRERMRLTRLAERVALVAAAADRADHPPVGMDEHLRADALRRGPARLDDGDERHRLAAGERLGERRQDLGGHSRILHR